MVFAIASLARSFMSAVRASVRALASSANFLTVSFMVLNPLVAAATGFGAALRVLLDWGAIVFWAAVLGAALRATGFAVFRSEEHTSELQSLMRTSYAVFCLKKK